MKKKGVKVRIYPNKGMESKIEDYFKSTMELHNELIAYKIRKYKKENESITFKDLSKYFYAELRDAKYIDYHSVIMDQVVRNIQITFRNYINGNYGYPRPKKFNTSFTIPGKCLSKKTDFSTKRFTFTKEFKDIKFRCSDRDVETLMASKVISATISKEPTGKYYCSFNVEVPDELIKKYPKTGKVVGFDIGVKNLLTGSDGFNVPNPKIYNRYRKRIKRNYKRVLKTDKNAKSYETERKNLSLSWAKFKNATKDYYHKLANTLLKEYDVIYLEDFQVSGLLKTDIYKIHLQRLNISLFYTILEGKADLMDKKVIKIDKYYPSSKTCSNCGNIKKTLSLLDRVYKCEKCNIEIDRDFNAAKNILNAGKINSI